MQEYRDGSYGPIRELDELKQAMDDKYEMARTKAIHFGERAELEAIKQQEGSLNTRRVLAKLEQLERKINRVIVHLGIETPGEILVVD